MAGITRVTVPRTPRVSDAGAVSGCALGGAPACRTAEAGDQRSRAEITERGQLPKHFVAARHCQHGSF